MPVIWKLRHSLKLKRRISWMSSCKKHMKPEHTRNRLFIRRRKGDTMEVVFEGNVQMQTGNKNRKEWFLISKSDSRNIPLQHIQHYRKHMMPGLQGMWPAIWKTEKAEETCILHRKVKEYFFNILWKRERMPPPPICLGVFCGFYWMVGLGSRGGFGFFFFQRPCWISQYLIYISQHKKILQCIQLFC